MSALDLRMREDGLQLGAEIKLLASMRDVERLDADAIAGETRRRCDSVQMAMANMPRNLWNDAMSHWRNACRTVSVSQCEWKLCPSFSSSARISKWL